VRFSPLFKGTPRAVPDTYKEPIFKRAPTMITLLSRRVTNKYTFNGTRVKFSNIISIVMNKENTFKDPWRNNKFI
jgi:hypothetical protein